jgi:thymidylate synthase
MALPPCHLLCQFYVREDKYLSCSLYQRSGDVGLGIPFNIASYSFLTHLLAHFCGLEAESFVHFIGDAHIYVEHLDALREQLLRNPKPFPQIEIVTSGKREKIEDYTERDISWKTPYEHHSVISMEMKA